MQFQYGTLVAAIIAINESFKSLGLPSRFIPLVSVILGILASHFFVHEETIPNMVFIGVLLGLSANGLFDISKVFRCKNPS